MTTMILFLHLCLSSMPLTFSDLCPDSDSDIDDNGKYHGAPIMMSCMDPNAVSFFEKWAALEDDDEECTPKHCNNSRRVKGVKRPCSTPAIVDSVKPSCKSVIGAEDDIGIAAEPPPTMLLPFIDDHDGIVEVVAAAVEVEPTLIVEDVAVAVEVEPTKDVAATVVEVEPTLVEDVAATGVEVEPTIVLQDDDDFIDCSLLLEWQMPPRQRNDRWIGLLVEAKLNELCPDDDGGCGSGTKHSAADDGDDDECLVPTTMVDCCAETLTKAQENSPDCASIDWSHFTIEATLVSCIDAVDVIRHGKKKLYAGICRMPSERWSGMQQHSHNQRFDQLFVLCCATRSHLLYMEKEIIKHLRAQADSRQSCCNILSGGQSIRAPHGFLYLCC